MPFRRRLVLLALALLPATAAAQAPSAEILWDSYGVPHIAAADDESLFLAFGWAQARNHGDLLLRLLGKARARGAEYWGEEHLDDDRWFRTMRLAEQATEVHAQLSPAWHRNLDAFAEGINRYARTHPDSIDDAVEVVLPVTAHDVLANAGAVGLLFSSARQGAARWEGARGSNAWAIGPDRTESGNAMLLANPHLPWGGGFTWFEAQLTAPGLDAYGATLLGLPVLGIAFNDHLGWTHTVNTHDTEDLYELTLEGDGYRWDGGVRPFAADTQTIRVRLPGGGFREETLVRRSSLHGPVVGERAGRALAVRRISGRGADQLRQWWGMMRARDRAEFERALELHAIVGQNVTYADRDGNVLFSYGAASPRRPRGDRAFWAGIVPGDSSSLLWTDVIPYSETPRVLNPPSGWVQNANDGPWFSTYPAALVPDAFPDHLAPRGLALRPQQSIQLLVESGDLTLEEMVRLKHDNEMELAVRVLPELLAAARASGSAEARAAADVLERWDRTADAESRGGVLFQAWHAEVSRTLPGPRLFATPWTPAAPVSTPDGLADPAASVAALEEAARSVREAWGVLDVAWGEVHRLRRDGLDLPANGGPGTLGVFRTMHYEEAPDGKLVPFHGDSYVAAVEFSDPVRALALVGYGNASQPGSPHRTDQLGLYAAKRLRPVWRSRAEIEAHLRDREVF